MVYTLNANADTDTDSNDISVIIFSVGTNGDFNIQVSVIFECYSIGNAEFNYRFRFLWRDSEVMFNADDLRAVIDQK